MNESDKHMLDWVEFVTDKFSANHEPWKYSRDTGGLRCIRYEKDYTGYNHWAKRIKRFLRNITKDHFIPTGIWKELEGKKTLIKKIVQWPKMVRVHWIVSVKKDSNLLDGQVNGIITHWEEDGEYITMFCPYVGREVLKFLRAEPENEYAKSILKAMRETQEISWPREEE